MSNSLPAFLPVLAVGSHNTRDTGKGCAMNVLSFLGGDTLISDTPKHVKVHPVLRSALIKLNDTLCFHVVDGLICPSCSTVLYERLFAVQGSGEGGSDKEINVRLAIFCARSVIHLVRESDKEVCLQAIEAAEAWLENPCQDTLDAANATNAATYVANAANAADAAANAADAAADAATYAANAANATYAAANAAVAATYAANATANAATYAANRTKFYDNLFAYFCEIMNWSPSSIPDESVLILWAATCSVPTLG